MLCQKKATYGAHTWSKNQCLLQYIIEVSGEISDNQITPHLEKLLLRNDLWGVNIRNTCIALIKLGEANGLNFIKSVIQDRNKPYELRSKSAEMLYRIGLRDIYEIDEDIIDWREIMSEECYLMLKRNKDKE